MSNIFKNILQNIDIIQIQQCIHRYIFMKVFLNRHLRMCFYIHIYKKNLIFYEDIIYIYQYLRKFYEDIKLIEGGITKLKI